MNIRLTVLELTARHRLSAGDAARLTELAGVNRQPPRLVHHVVSGLAVVAALLGGLGIIFWIAANWDSIPRAGRFALVESFFGVMCIGALLRPNARVAFSLMAFLSTGGLLALFGQTYQTGADPWQLFAWWSAIALPLCVGVRHDALWTAWTVVAMTALTLWTSAHDGHQWTTQNAITPFQLAHWGGALLLAVALSPQLRKVTGAGIWSFRSCLLLATAIIAVGATKSLGFSMTQGMYYLGLLLLAGLFAIFCRPALHDMFALSALGLGLNWLIVAGLTRALASVNGLGMGVFLLIGVSAAALLGATVKGILYLSHNREPKGSAQ